MEWHLPNLNNNIARKTSEAEPTIVRIIEEDQ